VMANEKVKEAYLGSEKLLDYTFEA
jgi:hypothetical protein